VNYEDECENGNLAIRKTTYIVIIINKKEVNYE